MWIVNVMDSPALTERTLVSVVGDSGREVLPLGEVLDFHGDQGSERLWVMVRHEVEGLSGDERVALLRYLLDRDPWKWPSQVEWQEVEEVLDAIDSDSDRLGEILAWHLGRSGRDDDVETMVAAFTAYVVSEAGRSFELALVGGGHPCLKGELEEIVEEFLDVDIVGDRVEGVVKEILGDDSDGRLPCYIAGTPVAVVSAALEEAACPQVFYDVGPGVVGLDDSGLVGHRIEVVWRWPEEGQEVDATVVLRGADDETVTRQEVTTIDDLVDGVRAAAARGAGS